jgi:hypothetical protein
MARFMPAVSLAVMALFSASTADSTAALSSPASLSPMSCTIFSAP